MKTKWFFNVLIYYYFIPCTIFKNLQLFLAFSSYIFFFLLALNSNSNQIVILPSMHNADKESELGTQACTLNEPSESESRPKKRKKISLDDLQRMQYEVTK